MRVVALHHDRNGNSDNDGPRRSPAIMTLRLVRQMIGGCFTPSNLAAGAKAHAQKMLTKEEERAARIAANLAAGQAKLDATFAAAYANLGVYGWRWRLRRWWKKHRAKSA